MENVILTGFMGCGKSSLGIKLSYRLKMPLLDTDKMIEKKQGCTISELFKKYGEEYFRNLETECIKDMQKQKSAYVISVGGGLPVKEENRALLKKLGMVVYLRVRPETVYARLKDDTTRPLLQGENPQEKIRNLMQEREKFYESGADFILDVDDLDTEQIMQKIVRHYWKRQNSNEHKKQGEHTKGNRETNMKLLVINGPNINFLGIREKSVYGKEDYNFLLNMIAKKGEETGCQIEVFQSNHEGAIIDRIQDSYFDGTEGIVINPGAYTHYSYAIRDALASITVPKVEIHISDITKREDFRKVSVTKEVCDTQIFGQGLQGYLMAIDYILGTKKQ